MGKNKGNEKIGTMFSFCAYIYSTFLTNFVSVTFRKEYKKAIRQTPEHCWCSVNGDCTSQMLPKKHLCKCTALCTVVASSVLHIKLPARETSCIPKVMRFLCWVLSPITMQIDKFLTLLLCVDYSSLYFWGVGIEENCNFVTVKYSVVLHLVEPVHRWE